MSFENEKEIGVHLKLCSFSSSATFPVLNIQNLQGLDERIEAFGFTENGQPANNKIQAKYLFIGKVTGYVDLTRVYRAGINLNSYRNSKGEIQQGKRVFGGEAISIMLQRNGLPMAPAAIEAKLETLVNDGATIYFYKGSSLSHMDTKTYKLTGGADKWILSGKHQIQDTDVWNEFLSKILHSKWRIKSKATEKLLASKALAKLLA